MSSSHWQIYTIDDNLCCRWNEIQDLLFYLLFSRLKWGLAVLISCNFIHIITSRRFVYLFLLKIIAILNVFKMSFHNFCSLTMISTASFSFSSSSSPFLSYSYFFYLLLLFLGHKKKINKSSIAQHVFLGLVAKLQWQSVKSFR